MRASQEHGLPDRWLTEVFDTAVRSNDSGTHAGALASCSQLAALRDV
jgi:hypothetical protein